MKHSPLELFCDGGRGGWGEGGVFVFSAFQIFE